MDEELIKRILSSIVLIPLTLFFIVKGSYFFTLFIFLVLIITLYEWHLLSYKKKYYLFGLIFITFSFYTFHFLRIENNYVLFTIIFSTCIATDIGGYIFGKLFKGPKLIKISPNKTYAGMFGSFFLSVILTILGFNISTFSKFYNIIEYDKYIIILIVILISFVSQIGDLTVSYFKRRSKMKNTGKIIPGHGGLLDRIDGMIFAFPFMFIFIKIFG